MAKNKNHERLDQATSARLALFGMRAVDTARLEQALEKAMAPEGGTIGRINPASAAGAAGSSMDGVWRRWWRPITSAAAAILIVMTIGWLALDGGTSAAMAAPAELAQIHYDVANGLTPHLKVSSVNQANQLLADQSNGVVPVPQLPGVMMSCCLHEHAGATLTCALIETEDGLITVAIADGAKLHSPRGNMIRRGDRQLIAHAANGINMVMAHEGDRWLCVMGEVDFERLADVAAEIRL
jgi:hypothetical protein